MYMSKASHPAVHEHQRPPIYAEEAAGFHKRVKMIHDPVKIVVPCAVFEVEFPIPPDKGAHLSSYVELLDDHHHIEASQRGLRFRDEVDKGPAEAASIDTDRISSIDTDRISSNDINKTASIDATTSPSIDTGHISEQKEFDIGSSGRTVARGNALIRSSGLETSVPWSKLIVKDVRQLRLNLNPMETSCLVMRQRPGGVGFRVGTTRGAVGAVMGAVLSGFGRKEFDRGKQGVMDTRQREKEKKKDMVPGERMPKISGVVHKPSDIAGDFMALNQGLGRFRNDVHGLGRTDHGRDLYDRD
uniref:Uncharacterized protein n=1 Tax=Brassica oleracea var. oleracea TaxID=109376 RepID=A0A0D3CFS8_BRAOL